MSIMCMRIAVVEVSNHGLSHAPFWFSLSTFGFADRDGGYSYWGRWSVCSVTCGGGIRSRSRPCTNPPPRGFGKNCDHLGPATETEPCNAHECGASVHHVTATWTLELMLSSLLLSSVVLLFSVGSFSLSLLFCSLPFSFGISILLSSLLFFCLVIFCWLHFPFVFFRSLLFSFGISVLFCYLLFSSFVLLSSVGSISLSFSSVPSCSLLEFLFCYLLFSSVVLLSSVGFFSLSFSSVPSCSLLEFLFCYLHFSSVVLLSSVGFISLSFSSVPSCSVIFTSLVIFCWLHFPFVFFRSPLFSLFCYLPCSSPLSCPSLFSSLSSLFSLLFDFIFLRTCPQSRGYLNAQLMRILCSDLTDRDGNFTEWSDWPECPVTCGGATIRRSRTCTSPPPAGGGKNCDDLGPAEETRECNVYQCSEYFFGPKIQNRKHSGWLSSNVQFSPPPPPPSPQKNK